MEGSLGLQVKRGKGEGIEQDWGGIGLRAVCTLTDRARGIREGIVRSPGARRIRRASSGPLANIAKVSFLCVYTHCDGARGIREGIFQES